MSWGILFWIWIILMLFSPLAQASQVTRWRPVIEQECNRLHLDPCPTLQTVALIKVESNGNPRRRKSDDARFWGLLQMSAEAGAEVGIKARKTHGDGRLAIRAHLKLRKKYRRRWSWAPRVGVALFWKMGPGALRRVKHRVEAGEGLEVAVSRVSSALGLGRSLVYLERYRRALRKLRRGAQ